MNLPSSFIKDLGLWVLLALVGLLLITLILLGIIFIYVGLSHTIRTGVWMPLTFGIIIISVCSWLFWTVLKYFTKEIKNKDISLT